jgi:hypothetical protein
MSFYELIVHVCRTRVVEFDAESMKSDRTYFKYGKDIKGLENLSDIGLASGIATSLVRAVPQQHNNHSHCQK